MLNLTASSLASQLLQITVLNQFFMYLSAHLLIQLPPKLLLASNLGSNRQSIAIHQPIAHQRRDFYTGQQRAGEVQRIDPAHCDQAAVMGPTPDLAQQWNRFGQGELLTRQAADKPPATNLAPRQRQPKPLNTSP